MSEQIMRENLLVIAQAYATAKGWSLATVSKRIHGNQRFLAEFLAGEVSTTIRTYHQMLDKLRAEWPPGAKWPKTRDVTGPVLRPAPMLPRGSSGKFLGKNNPRRSAHA